MTRMMKGGPELLKFLGQFPVNLQRNVLRGALRAGAGVIRDQARANLAGHQVTGKLAKAVKTGSRTDGGQVRAYVKLLGAHSYIGTFMEYGVRPHFINAGKDAKLSARKTTEAMREGRGQIKNGVIKINGQLVSGAVYHPGTPARPFLRPAFDLRADDAILAMGAYIKRRLSIGNLQAPDLTLDDDA